MENYNCSGCMKGSHQDYLTKTSDYFQRRSNLNYAKLNAVGRGNVDYSVM